MISNQLFGSNYGMTNLFLSYPLNQSHILHCPDSSIGLDAFQVKLQSLGIEVNTPPRLFPSQGEKPSRKSCCCAPVLPIFLLGNLAVELLLDVTPTPIGKMALSAPDGVRGTTQSPIKLPWERHP